MVFDIKDTITAISTPSGYGGIGVVRISGPDAKSIAQRIFRKVEIKNRDKENRYSEENDVSFFPRKMYYGHIFSQQKKEILDEALLVYMPAPHSYTTDDVIEIQAHGGTVTQKAILETVLDCGARLAEPGEFTRRAFLGGRIDLSQAEAVIDVIQAKTETALKLATRQREGVVGEAAKRIKERLLDLYAMMEAEIEFPEELEAPSGQTDPYPETVEDLERSIDRVLDGYRKGHLVRDGLRLIVVGRVNVGKSSLMNRLLEKERAIVTEYPGTTRDSIEETLDVFGLPVVLIDTAGWRKTKDPVERLGIERTQQLIERADLILFMVDAGQGIVAEDHDLYERIEKKDKILVVNKTDLLKGTKSISIPDHWKFFEVRYTAVKFERGIDALKEALFRFGIEDGSGIETAIVPNIRQKRLFEKAQSAIGAARRSLQEDQKMELAVMDLKEAMGALDQITGASIKTDVLDSIFSRFCIGK